MIRPLASVSAIPADMLARLAAAEQIANEAKADAVAAEGRAEVARLEAVKAEATGQNARQMVLNDRDKIAAVQTAATDAAAKADAIDVKRSEYEAALAASVSDRAGIHSALEVLAARVAALEALRVTVGFGSATLTGSLLAGAIRDVPVTLSRDMGSAAYSAGSSISGGTTLLGQLVHDGIVSQTKTAITVRVRNTGLAAIANLSTAVVYVVAAREA